MTNATAAARPVLSPEAVEVLHSQAREALQPGKTEKISAALRYEDCLYLAQGNVNFRPLCPANEDYSKYIPNGYKKVTGNVDWDLRSVDWTDTGALPKKGDPLSTHALEHLDGVELYYPPAPENGEVLQNGPIIVFHKENKIVHTPGKHGTLEVPANIVISVHYQLEYSKVEKAARLARD